MFDFEILHLIMAWFDASYRMSESRVQASSSYGRLSPAVICHPFVLVGMAAVAFLCAPPLRCSVADDGRKRFLGMRPLGPHKKKNVT